MVTSRGCLIVFVGCTTVLWIPWWFFDDLGTTKQGCSPWPTPARLRTDLWWQFGMKSIHRFEDTNGSQFFIHAGGMYLALPFPWEKPMPVAFAVHSLDVCNEAPTLMESMSFLVTWSRGWSVPQVAGSLGFCFVPVFLRVLKFHQGCGKENGRCRCPVVECPDRFWLINFFDQRQVPVGATRNKRCPVSWVGLGLLLVTYDTLRWSLKTAAKPRANPLSDKLCLVRLGRFRSAWPSVWELASFCQSQYRENLRMRGYYLQCTSVCWEIAVPKRCRAEYTSSAWQTHGKWRAETALLQI